jgi:hypothetical protein
MRCLIALTLGLLLAGCVAREITVDCDGRLEPINAPAPAAHAGKVTP